MSKAILVTDMPEGCSYCDYCHTKPYDNRHRIDGEKFCGILNEDVEVYYYYGDGRPEFCPLRKFPNKSLTGMSDYYQWGDWEDGWNACIDEILGEK